MHPVPIAIYAVLAIVVLLCSRQAGGLKAVLVASYCGVIITSFTGGASGAIWLAPFFLFLISPAVVIRRPVNYAFNSTAITKITYMMIFLFVIGVVIGFIRYDPILEGAKAGSYRTFFGLPLSFMMMMYRLHVVAFLFLAFALPLHYHIDRKMFLQCLVLSWIFTLVLAASVLLNHFGIYNMQFHYTVRWEFTRQAILGFYTASLGLMLVMGIFMSFAMTQITHSYTLRILGYVSIPMLIFAIPFAWSRAALFGLIIGAISLSVILGGTKALKAILFTIVGAIVVYLVLSRSYEVSERFLKGLGEGAVSLEEASSGRIAGWISVIRWLTQNPGVLMFGVGFQNFQYFVRMQSEVGTLGGGHNNWLHLFTEFGFFGFIVFNGWLVLIFRWLLSWRRTMTNKTDRTIPGIFISLMLGMSVTCLTQSTFAPSSAVVPWLLHFYLMLGIWVSYYRTQMLEISADLESLDGEQYVYEGCNFADDISYEAEQYYDYSY